MSMQVALSQHAHHCRNAWSSTKWFFDTFKATNGGEQAGLDGSARVATPNRHITASRSMDNLQTRLRLWPVTAAGTNAKWRREDKSPKSSKIRSYIQKWRLFLPNHFLCMIVSLHCLSQRLCYCVSLSQRKLWKRKLMQFRPSNGYCDKRLWAILLLTNK